MANTHERRALATLNAELFNLVATFPKAKGEFIDFFLKHAVESYVHGIHEFPGRKRVQIVEKEDDAASAIRRGMILADLVCFSVNEFVGPAGFGVLPISDDFASPVLGASAMKNPQTGRFDSFATAEAWLAVMVLSELARSESSAAVRLLSTEWSGAGHPRWERTMFARLADQFVDARGVECHLAGGYFHTVIPQASSLFEDCEPLMRSGRLVFTPFVCPSTPTLSQGEGVLKADILDASFLTTSTVGLGTSSEDLLLDLEVPYIEDVPLPLLAKILDDENESLDAFRTKLDRALEDISLSKDPNERSKQALKLKRELLQDELEKVRQTCARIARMNSIARSGAYVAATCLSVAAMYGHAIPSVIAGCSAPLIASIKALWDNYEARREVRRNPAYFLWRIGARIRP